MAENINISDAELEKRQQKLDRFVENLNDKNAKRAVAAEQRALQHGSTPR